MTAQSKAAQSKTAQSKAAGSKAVKVPRSAPSGPAGRPGVELVQEMPDMAGVARGVLRNARESPLAWLARRTGRDGRPLVDGAQLAAGERLRLDFTRAGLSPRVTSRWEMPAGGGGPEAFTDMVMAAKQRVAGALAAVGPELSGVLLDVCCFLKGLEEVERERGWPARTAKVVLGLALARLARHYGLSAAATGRARGRMRAWHAPADGAPWEEVPATGGEGEGGRGAAAPTTA